MGLVYLSICIWLIFIYGKIFHTIHVLWIKNRLEKSLFLPSSFPATFPTCQPFWKWNKGNPNEATPQKKTIEGCFLSRSTNYEYHWYFERSPNFETSKVLERNTKRHQPQAHYIIFRVFLQRRSKRHNTSKSFTFPSKDHPDVMFFLVRMGGSSASLIPLKIRSQNTWLTAPQKKDP